MITQRNVKVPKSSLSKRNVQKFCQNKAAVICFFGLAIMIFACVFAPFVTPYDPNEVTTDIIELMNNRNLGPSWEHPFGTDRLARDLFSRVLYGGRWSIFIGLTAAMLTATVGIVLGAIAGFFGGWVDSVLVAIQEFLSVFPGVLLLLIGITIFGPGIPTMMAVWAITGWGGMMRMVRAKIMSLKNEPFVESCRAVGIGSASIMFRHMLPNTLGPIIVSIVSSIGSYMIAEAGLSYLGLGVPETMPTWGNIINAAKNLEIVQSSPMVWLAPGLTMCLFVTCVNCVGNGLRDALDPTAK